MNSGISFKGSSHLSSQSQWGIKSWGSFEALTYIFFPAGFVVTVVFVFDAFLIGELEFWAASPEEAGIEILLWGFKGFLYCGGSDFSSFRAHLLCSEFWNAFGILLEITGFHLSFYYL